MSAGQLTRIPDELDDQQGALVEPIAVCRTRRRPRRGRSGQFRARHRRRADRHAQRRVRHRPRGDDGHRVRTQRRAPVDRRGARRPGDARSDGRRRRRGRARADRRARCRRRDRVLRLGRCARRVHPGDPVARDGGADRACTSARRRSTPSSSRCTRSRSSARGATRSPTGRASSPCSPSGRMDGRPAVTSALGLDATVDGFERLIDRRAAT